MDPDLLKQFEQLNNHSLFNNDNDVQNERRKLTDKERERRKRIKQIAAMSKKRNKK